MNTADRRRAARLIEDEISSRILALRGDIDQSLIDKEFQRLVRHLGIGPLMKQLESYEKKSRDIRKHLSGLASTLVDKKKTKRSRMDDCECVEDFGYIIEKVAQQNVKAAIDAERKVEQLRTTRRNLLAQIEVCSTAKELSAILKSAGLI